MTSTTSNVTTVGCHVTQNTPRDPNVICVITLSFFSPSHTGITCLTVYIGEDIKARAFD